jgi:uncharacterized membrane protein
VLNNFVVNNLVKTGRDLSVDTLRGIAIFIMIGANMVPYSLFEPHPLIERAYASFAAPLFVLLAGMMVSFGTRKGLSKGHASIKPFLTKGGLLILIGALIDVLIHKHYPLFTMDVLFLIGISMPLVYLLEKVNYWYRLALAAALFVVAPILHATVGYEQFPLVLNVVGGHSVPAEQLSFIYVVKNLGANVLLHGSFPLIPWLGYSVLGSFLGAMRWRWTGTCRFNHWRIVVVALVLLVVGVLWWVRYPGEMYAHSYSELFYPPTLGFIITSVGVAILLFCIVDYAPTLGLYRFFQVYGESSMFIYILHLVIIEYDPYIVFIPRSLLWHTIFYLIFAGFIWAVAWKLRQLKPRLKSWPSSLRFIMGA